LVVSKSKFIMMKVVSLVIVATVLVSRSSAIPVPDADPQGIFDNNFHGGVGTVQQCGVTGACTSNPNPNAPRPVIHGSTQNNFNTPVNTVQQCGVNGACGPQGKKKRSTDESEEIPDDALEAKISE